MLVLSPNAGLLRSTPCPAALPIDEALDDKAVRDVLLRSMADVLCAGFSAPAICNRSTLREDGMPERPRREREDVAFMTGILCEAAGRTGMTESMGIYDEVSGSVGGGGEGEGE